MVKAILETWLPTKWSKLIAGLTIALVVPSTRLPEFLRYVQIEMTNPTALLIRTGMPLLVLLSGTFLVLLMVIQHSKTLKSQKQPQAPMPILAKKPAVFPKEQIDILLCIFEKTGDTLTITLSPTVQKDLDFCSKFLQETKQHGTGLTLLHDKAFLLTGPNSFEIAMSLSRMLSDSEIQFVICEVESILLCQAPAETEEDF